MYSRLLIALNVYSFIFCDGVRHMITLISKKLVTHKLSREMS